MANQVILCTAVGDSWGLFVNLFADNVVNLVRNLILKKKTEQIAVGFIDL